jgi:hypothetical protein
MVWARSIEPTRRGGELRAGDRRAGCVGFFLVLAGSALVFGTEASGSAVLLKPLRTDTPPVIDGRLDDTLWSEAPSVTDFLTFIPDFGKRQPERTVTYMAYDAENLYFAFRCLDDQRDQIKAAMARRDSILTDDFICINLDTFGDQQSLYAFYVNPLGIQADSRFASNQEDFNVDLVWYSAGRIDEQGYTVEIQIPLKSIRYNNRKRVEMAVFFERFVSRRNEHASYPALDPQRGYAFLTQMAPMEYFDLRRYVLLEALPAFTYGQQYVRGEGGLEREPSVHDFSLTGKYGITPSLILDGTYNPDFSQIEADAGQIDANLRYGLFYAEKRPFFLEGSESFTTGAATFAFVQPVHTRTIVDPRIGIKLSGKLGRKDTVASVFAVDEMPPGTGDDARFSILRYKRATSQDGYLGVLVTDREQDGAFNRVAGADGQIRVGKSDMLSFCTLGSSTKDDTEEASADGHSATVEYLHDSSTLALGVAAQDVSEDFRADAGYVTRTGASQFVFQAIPKFYPRSGRFRRIDPLLTSIQTRDHDSGLWETSNGAGVRAILTGNTTLLASYDYSTEVFLGRRFSTSGVTINTRSQLSKKVTLALVGRYGKAIRYAAEPFQGYGSSIQASAVYLPVESLNLTVNVSYADLYRDATSEKVYDYWIYRGKATYQLNKYLFVRAILEYNSYREQLLTDFLASFTYIPGTVVHLGYGSLHAKFAENGTADPEADHLRELKRGLFAKVSYLWRL